MMTTPLEESADPPKWMLELENKRLRKQHHQLGHEFGAGSKCNVCKDGCPGLDLHFWRKRCRACRCKKEDHDVPMDDGHLRFEILFSNQDNAKRFNNIKAVLDMTTRNDLKMKPIKTKNAILDQIMKTRGPTEFDWVPPDVPEELAIQYMKDLPENKLPISGSHGAKYRQIQLQKQIPIYDVAPLMCNSELSPMEVQCYEDYLKNLQDNAVGQGRIQKLCQRKFVESSVPLDSPPDAKYALRIRQGLMKKKALDMDNNLQNMRNLNITPFTAPNISNYVKPSTHTPANTLTPPFTPATVLRLPSDFKSGHSSLNEQKPLPFFHIKPDPDLTQGEEIQMSGINNLPDDDRILGEQSNQSGDLKEHDIHSQSTVEAGHGLYSMSPVEAGEIGKNDASFCLGSDYSDIQHQPRAYSFIDPDDTLKSPSISDIMSVSYLSDVPEPYEIHTQHGFDSHPGRYKEASARQDTVNTMVPADNANYQDNPNANANHGTYEDHQLVVENPLDCKHCGKEIPFGSVLILADRAGKDVAWHPHCFVCDDCQEMLVDLLYFYHKGKVYCGRHYAEKMEILRCQACDELIFVNEYTMAEGKAYHVRHFCCADCDIELAGKKYLVINEQPTCLECYRSSHSKSCQACKQPINPEDQALRLNDLDWHGRPECFCCKTCRKNLLNQKFILNQNNPYCSRNCVVAGSERA